MQNKASPDEKAMHHPCTTPKKSFRTEFAPTPRTFEGKLYYGAADVAKILGVTKRTVQLWHNTYYKPPLR